MHLTLTQEKKLLIGLVLCVSLILALTGALAWSLQWGSLGIITILFFASYPLAFAATKIYQFWRDNLIQLTTYTQSLQVGKQNLRLKQYHNDSLMNHLRHEIDALNAAKQQQHSQQKTTSQLLMQILEAWPIPVCLFDSNLRLSYRNAAMIEHMNHPMLVGSSAKEIGFTLSRRSLKHNQFNAGWQSQTIEFQSAQHSLQSKHWLFTAIDVSEKLNQSQTTAQQNLIRVLAHELRNSLTPMQSMTDTLLASDSLDRQQTQLVLTRINQRSKRLLSFISQYSQLSQLPSPNAVWFDFTQVMKEAELLIVGTSHRLHFQGEKQCFGDSQQLSQVIINLVKNAIEASSPEATNIVVVAYCSASEQMIDVSDNGPGFSNTENALVPFYTTKTGGSGIGLSLCAEIAKNHGGSLHIQNYKQEGAKISMRWPIAQHREIPR